MKFSKYNPVLFSVLFGILLAIALTGCGKTTGKYPEPVEPVVLSGTVSAPGGQVVFNHPGWIKRMLAEFLGRTARATISGISPVGPGIVIELIEVDAAGAQVGDVIATATTNGNGAFSLDAPEDFSEQTRFIVRAGGPSGIEARVTGLTVDVDPATDATSNLVTEIAGNELSRISLTDIGEILMVVEDVADNMDPDDLADPDLDISKADGLSKALVAELKADEEASRLVGSIAASGRICGNVKDSSDVRLEGISIVVRDFGDWVTRAKTKTDANGDYCVSVPAKDEADPLTGEVSEGEYIIGAINRTAVSMAASEWWSEGGAAYLQIDAEQVEVLDTAPVTARDFVLEPGFRIEGTVKAKGGDLDGQGLKGVKVLVRDFATRFPAASAKVKEDGGYRVNVLPGKYLLIARNKTKKPYGTEIYNGADGTNNRNYGAPVEEAAGNTFTAGFDLELGYKLSGVITVPNPVNSMAAIPVPGVRVQVNDTNQVGPVVRLRTNKKGKYRVWLKPGNYDVYAYGQRDLNIDMTNADYPRDFSDAVAKLPVTVSALGGADVVSQAKVRLYDNSNTFIGSEVSNSDGSLTLYSNTEDLHRVVVRIDSQRPYGSIVYNGKTELLDGDIIQLSLGDNSAITIDLPEAGVLTGKVTEDGTAAAPNIQVQVNDCDGGGCNSSSATRFVRTRTRGDGTYTLSLPAGTYERIVVGSVNAVNCDNDIPITAGTVTNLDVDLSLSSASACTVTSP